MSTNGYGPIIPNGFWQRPDVLELQADDESRSALLVLLEFMSYSMTARTDGFIPRVAIRMATMHPDPNAAIARLVEVGILEPSGKGWSLDWSGQMSAERLEARRVKDADWDRHRHGNHRECGIYESWGCHKDGSYKAWCEENGLPELVTGLATGTPRAAQKKRRSGGGGANLPTETPTETPVKDRTETRVEDPVVTQLNTTQPTKVGVVVEDEDSATPGSLRSDPELRAEGAPSVSAPGSPAQGASENDYYEEF